MAKTTEWKRFDEEVGRRIARFQKQAKLLDPVLAGLAGFDPGQLKEYKSGEVSIPAYRLKRIACILDVSTDALVGLDKN